MRDGVQQRVLHGNIDQTVVNSLHGLLSFYIECRVIAAEDIVSVH